LRFPLLAAVAALVSPAEAQVVIPFGYRMDPIVIGGLVRPTAMARDGAGRLYVTQYGPGGGAGGVKIVFPGESAARDYATVPQIDSPAGIVLEGTRVMISNRASGVDQGQIVEYIDRNGNFLIDGPGEFRIVISDLPQGLNGTRALVLGPGGRYYVGQGSLTNNSSQEGQGINTKVFSFDLVNPLSRTIFASGFFNPLGIAFEPGGRAFVTDRSPAQDTDPDELNLAEEGDYFGFGPAPPPPASPKPPLLSFPHFSSPAGVAYFPAGEFTGGVEAVFVALEGHPAGLPEPAPKIVKVALQRDGGGITAEISDFARGLDRPFGLLRVTLGTGAEALFVSDFAADRIYQIRRRTPSDPPDYDWDRSGRIDSGDLLILIREHRSGEPEFADLNEDGRVDSNDLFIFSTAWEGDASG